MKSLPIIKKACGGCTACCIIMLVEELKKSNYIKCKHQGDGCCNQYDNRPPSCRTWECFWLKGKIEGDERRRPDQLGLMFTETMLKDHDAGREACVLSAWEVWPGAVKEQTPLLRKLSKKYTIVIIPYNDGNNGYIYGSNRKCTVEFPILK